MGLMNPQLEPQQQLEPTVTIETPKPPATTAATDPIATIETPAPSEPFNVF